MVMSNPSHPGRSIRENCLITLKIAATCIPTYTYA